MAAEGENKAAAGSDDRPALLVKLQERKAHHKQRGRLHRTGVVVLGFVIVLVGIVMAGPGVPGPGIAVMLFGLFFLALEFDRAERLLERAIVWADKAKDRAEAAPAWQKRLTGALTALGIAAFVAAAIVWDIPLLPV
jgi:Putative transmembrane protein (PGPGW)